MICLICCKSKPETCRERQVFFFELFWAHLASNFAESKKGPKPISLETIQQGEKTIDTEFTTDKKVAKSSPYKVI